MLLTTLHVLVHSAHRFISCLEGDVHVGTNFGHYCYRGSWALKTMLQSNGGPCRRGCRWVSNDICEVWQQAMRRQGCVFIGLTYA